MQLYQKECLRLRKITEYSVKLLMTNGLDKKLKNSKMMKKFMKTINWHQFDYEFKDEIFIQEDP